jgi:hypothetical protein
MKKIAHPIRCIGHAAMPGLAIEQIEIARLHVQQRRGERWKLNAVGLWGRVRPLCA